MGNTNPKLALLTILAVWIDPDTNKRIRHFYSCVSSDIKEDAYHACSYLYLILEQVCFIIYFISFIPRLNKNLHSIISFGGLTTAHTLIVLCFYYTFGNYKLCTMHLFWLIFILLEKEGVIWTGILVPYHVLKLYLF